MARRASPVPQPPRTTTRCAIYTRKSSEEGLEQAFNSLDAQREACEAYIKSQQHEGWVCLPSLYDDGGISGGTMERPALRRLLADIEAGRVDAVVVYKVDRLTRSLHDFARMVEVFDRRHVSFVSITQQFNTTTSMGRLTLNMLLSFAQFEREVTGERIRDKIAASKRKGMWMGGPVPLGYDVRERKLHVNEEEAKTVRHIFARYAALGSVFDLQEELRRDGIVGKVRVTQKGRRTGGNPMARGALYALLHNPIYRGKVGHKGVVYEGEHQAILDEELWNRVQDTLAANRVSRANGTHAAEPSLLAGLLYDEAGRRLVPSHACKGRVRYRYYVAQELVKGRTASAQGVRLPASELEHLVQEQVRALLQNGAKLFEVLEPCVPHALERREIVGQAHALANRWNVMAAPERRAVLQALLERVMVEPDQLRLMVRPGGIVRVLRGEEPPGSTEASLPLHEASVPARLQRVGMGKRMLLEGQPNPRRAPDLSLHRLLAQAQRFKELVLRGDGKSLSKLAAAEGITASYFVRLLRLGFLAPGVTRMILQDKHPLDLSAKRVTLESDVKFRWAEQRHRTYGD